MRKVSSSELVRDADRHLGDVRPDGRCERLRVVEQRGCRSQVGSDREQRGPSRQVVARARRDLAPSSPWWCTARPRAAGRAIAGAREGGWRCATLRSSARPRRGSTDRTRTSRSGPLLSVSRSWYPSLARRSPPPNARRICTCAARRMAPSRDRRVRVVQVLRSGGRDARDPPKNRCAVRTPPPGTAAPLAYYDADGA